MLNFMDLSIWCNDDGKLRTNVHRKKTPTLKISNFKSNRPGSSQYGILKGLLNRAHKLCDEVEDLKDETEFLTDIFIANDYKPGKVDEIVRTYKIEGKDSWKKERK